jgi:hypothetical protein
VDRQVEEALSVPSAAGLVFPSSQFPVLSSQFGHSHSKYENSIGGETAMNFLSKLLQGIAFIPAVVNGIEGLFGGRSGADKKDAALSFVQAALSMSEAVTNRQIVDEAKFKDGLSKVIDGTVECLNASVWAQAGQSQNGEER